mgnify:FL=1
MVEPLDVAQILLRKATGLTQLTIGLSQRVVNMQILRLLLFRMK